MRAIVRQHYGGPEQLAIQAQPAKVFDFDDIHLAHRLMESN